MCTAEEKLPEPKRHVHLDLSRGDAEIFRDHYMLAGHGAARAGLGDMWEDATRSNLFVTDPGNKLSWFIYIDIYIYRYMYM